MQVNNILLESEQQGIPTLILDYMPCVGMNTWMCKYIWIEWIQIFSCR